jgi:RimJ/RimL family protein N-acetyltransferase
MSILIDGGVKLRALAVNDASALASLANNINIWNNVRDLFPHPYSLQDAWDFISVCEQEDPVYTFAIEYKGEFAGVIGLVQKIDVNRQSAELGYWLGEPYWNQGIVTRAAKLIVNYGFEHLGLSRIYSCVFDFNKGSQRVLEKAGFTLEGVLKNDYIKNNQLGDGYLYGIVPGNR